MGEYRTAEICTNGHVVTDSIEESQEGREKYCSKCGSGTITKCPSCEVDIRGYHHCPGFVSMKEYSPPLYCYNCGKAFPWTELKIASAIELIEYGGNLEKEELSQFKNDIELIVRQAPNEPVASLRMKKVMAKVGNTIGGAIKEILISIVSEAARKTIWGQ